MKENSFDPFIDSELTDQFGKTYSVSDLKRFRELSAVAAEQLQQLAGSTESDFLHIGNRLQEFLHDARRLSTESEKLGCIAAEQVLETSIQELRSLLGQFSVHLNQSSVDIKSDTGELYQILDRVTTITETLTSFKTIISQMRMLGIATKIESARLGNNDAGFTVIAENVEKLSTFINEKTASIVGKAQLLLSEINRSKQELSKLENEQSAQADIILRNTNQALSEFQEKYSAAAASTARIASEVQDVQKNISSVITSLQSHDITRQKIEHVAEALHQLPDEDAIEDEQSIREKSGMYYDVCQLQVSHLKDVHDEFRNAVLQIIEHMRNLEDDVENIFNSITGVIGTEAILGKESLGMIRKEFDSILTGLSKNTNIGQEVTASIKLIVGIVDELAEQVVEIEEVGTEIEIIALNAIVKAAQTGKNGAALGVLAQSIQKLSLETKERTHAVIEVLGLISSISQSLKERMETQVVHEQQDTNATMDARIGEILHPIESLCDNSEGVLSKLRLMTNNLKQAIEKEIRGITVHEIVGRTLTSIISDMEDAVMHTKKSGHLSSNRSKNTSKLFARYTMHSERKLHQQFTNQGQHTKESLRTKENKTAATEFGDNVELF